MDYSDPHPGRYSRRLASALVTVHVFIFSTSGAPPNHLGLNTHGHPLASLLRYCFSCERSSISFRWRSLPWRSYVLSRGRTQEPLEYIRVNPCRITVWMREYKNAQKHHSHHTTVKGYQKTSSKAGWGKVKG